MPSRITLSGIIIHGKWLGRELGYRTANMHIIPGSTELDAGTYAIEGTVRWERLSWVGVYIPQIETFESHWLDWEWDIYGETIMVDILYRIRDNQRFASLDELALQIGRDIEYVRKKQRNSE
jgi:riboflavin kinase / FMN adenylyltransferase